MDEVELMFTFIDDSIDAYNQEFGTSLIYEDLTDNAKEYFDLYLAILVAGFSISLFNQYSKQTKDEMIKSFGGYSNLKDYPGLELQIKTKFELLLEANPQAKDQARKNFLNEALASVTEKTGGYVYQKTQAELAIAEDKNFVVLRTRQDAKVRDSHSKHNGRLVNLLEYNPLLDYGCRCWITERFETRQDGQDAGYRFYSPSSKLRTPQNSQRKLVRGNIVA
jgi:hypothetical protein